MVASPTYSKIPPFFVGALIGSIIGSTLKKSPPSKKNCCDIEVIGAQIDNGEQQPGKGKVMYSLKNNGPDLDFTNFQYTQIIIEVSQTNTLSITQSTVGGIGIWKTGEIHSPTANYSSDSKSVLITTGDDPLLFMFVFSPQALKTGNGLGTGLEPRYLCDQGPVPYVLTVF